MKNDKGVFTLRPFKNGNGTTSYRVSGWLAGERIRRNFRSRAEAVAEKSILEIQSLQMDSGRRPAATLLTPEELCEAEAVMLRLRSKPHPLSFYVDYGLSHYQEPSSQKSLAEAVGIYLAQRREDFSKKLISAPQLQTIRVNLVHLRTCFPKEIVSGLTSEMLKVYCGRNNASLKTFNNRRGIASTFMKFACDQGWIHENPITRVPHYRIAHKRGTAPTLSAKQAEELMRHVEQFEDGRTVTFFALCLFAGIRPCLRTGEISKLRAKDINLETGVIHVEPDVSKVEMKRRVLIQPNLRAWLDAYPLDKYPILVPNMQRLRAKIVKQFSLSHDVLRHTFISMHVAKFRSMGDTALQAGNSEAVIRKYYLDVKSPEEAERFFAIFPEKGRMEPVREDILRFPSREWTTNVASRGVQRK